MMSVISKLYSWQYSFRQHHANKKYSPLKHFNNFSLEKTQNPEKVLIICAGLIGDSIMSSPVFIRARQIWKNAEITMLGPKRNCELFAVGLEIDRFKESSVLPFSLFKTKKENHLRNWLKSQTFDVAIVLSGGQFGKMLADSEIPIRVCGNTQTELPNFFTHLYDSALPGSFGPDDQLNSLRCLGFDIKFLPPKLRVQNSVHNSVSDKLKKLGLGENQQYIVIHPFGSNKIKWWQIGKTVELAKRLRENYNLATVLVGGNETVNYVPKDISNSIINTTGQFTLPELLGVIYTSNLVISTDSGPFHIAGAMNKPLIGLFRACSPAYADAYINGRTILGKNEICQRLCNWNYCRSNPCQQLSEIDVNSVLEFIQNNGKLIGFFNKVCKQ